METEIVYEDAPQVPLTDLLPELEFEFNDAPQGLLAHLMRRTIDRFCNDTNVIRRQCTVRTHECVQNYLMDIPDGVELIAVMRVVLLHSKYCAPDYRRTTVPLERSYGFCACAPYTVSVRKNELFFDPPAKHASFLIDMSVRPSSNACDVDKSLLAYEDTLLEGVRAKLYAQTGKPWSSAQRAVASDALFRQGCADAAVDTMMHQQRGAFMSHRRKF